MSIVERFFDVVMVVGNRLISLLTQIVALFWTGEQLTFFGILAVVALGISIFFLLVRVVQNFLHFRS